MKQSAEKFDEAYYLETYPDVADAVRAGAIRDALTHYERHGREEGRLGHAAQPAAVALFFVSADDETHATLEAIRVGGPARLFLVPLANPEAAEAVWSRLDWPGQADVVVPAGKDEIVRRLSGLEKIFERVERLIVLEAGMLVDPDFFLFCNVMLERCLTNRKILQVTGSCCAPSAEVGGRPWLSTHGETWGMATWSRAFKRLRPHLEESRPEEAKGWEGMFWGRRDPNRWVNRWHAAVSRVGGLVVVPPVNLVTHLGTTHPVVGKQQRRPLNGLVAPLRSRKRDEWLDGETWLHRFVLESWQPLPRSFEVVLTSPEDVVICHNEISDRHGVGALLGKLLRGRARWCAFRTETHFEMPACTNEIELSDGVGDERLQAYAEMGRELAGRHVGQILCVPYREVEAWRGVAAAAMTGRPLVVYLMDDQNIHADGIRDETMRALLNAATRTYAICEEMREAYAAKFGHPIETLYPAVADPIPASELNEPREAAERGVLIGNLWTADWVRRFANVVKRAGMRVDWFGNAGGQFQRVGEAELEAHGIRLRGFVPRGELSMTLRRYGYGVVPTATRSESGSHGWMAALSFPSKIMTQVFEGGLPLLVLAEGANPAVNFVKRTGLGVAAGYEPEEVKRAVELLEEADWRAAFEEAMIRWRAEFSLDRASHCIWGNG